MSYNRALGIIETLAPLHIGATAGEETGNLNLIFRDQFTQTGIIPGSSIRGRFRADMRSKADGEEENWYGRDARSRAEAETEAPVPETVRFDGGTTEALVKFEYASLLWIPVFCPGQPVVWVTCPRLLKRYKSIAKDLVPSLPEDLPAPYSYARGLQARPMDGGGKILFFNLGFLELEQEADLASWLPPNTELANDTDLKKQLVVVSDKDIAMIHDMALYRQSRVKLLDDMKKVDTKTGAFFNTEALPEGSLLVFPIALKEKGWKPFETTTDELYFGGLESIGFGRCRVTLTGVE